MSFYKRNDTCTNLIANLSCILIQRSRWSDSNRRCFYYFITSEAQSTTVVHRQSGHFVHISVHIKRAEPEIGFEPMRCIAANLNTNQASSTTGASRQNTEFYFIRVGFEPTFSGFLGPVFLPLNYPSNNADDIFVCC